MERYLVLYRFNYTISWRVHLRYISNFAKSSYIASQALHLYFECQHTTFIDGTWLQNKYKQKKNRPHNSLYHIFYSIGWSSLMFPSQRWKSISYIRWWAKILQSTSKKQAKNKSSKYDYYKVSNSNKEQY